MRHGYKVSIWKIEHRTDRKRNPYRLRWTVAGKQFSESFATDTAADNFRSNLKAAQNQGEAFDLKRGLPPSMVEDDSETTDEESELSCYEFFCMYAQHKKQKSAKYRRDIADVLRDIMCLMLPENGNRPTEETLRESLRRYAFNSTQSNSPEIDVKESLTWVEVNSPSLAVLSGMKQLRALLDGLTVLQNGSLAKPKYFAKRRRTLYNLLNWAVIEEHLDSNPLDSPKLKWKQDEELKIDDTIDPREVGNLRQMEAMLTAVSYVGKTQGPRMVAFFATIYYALARPEEVAELREEACELPEGTDEWGKLFLQSAAPEVGCDWTITGDAHEERGLKQRGRGSVRPVPIPPRLVWLLKDHIRQFGVAADGRLFRTLRHNRKGTRDNRIGTSTYNKVWKLARELAFPPSVRRTPLLKRPYSGRHSGISKRRYAGVPASQVAEWAGHSVEVSDRVYAKVMGGYDDRWTRQMSNFMAQEESGT